MLTPESNDPNRKSELARRKESPAAFGTTEVEARPLDWADVGLPSGDVESQAQQVEQTGKKKTGK